MFNYDLVQLLNLIFMSMEHKELMFFVSDTMGLLYDSSDSARYLRAFSIQYTLVVLVE